MSASPPRATMEEMDWEDAAPPLPFESFTHHNRLGIFLFSLTRVRTHGSFRSSYSRLSLLPLVLSVLFCSRSSKINNAILSKYCCIL